MLEKRAQVATEYLIITGFILVAVTIIFTYSFVTNNQNIKASQASNALDKMVNKADLVYALGPDNNLFAWVTFPRDIKKIQDITLCDDGLTVWQDHYEPPAVSCGNLDYVEAGAIEMTISLIGGPSAVLMPAKAEIELDIYSGAPPTPDKRIQAPIEGRHKILVYWCDPANNDKICLKRA